MYTHTRRIKRVPSSTMDVRGANTFLLHNRLPIPIFGRRPSYPLVWGFIYIFPFLLEQIKLGGNFTSFRELNDFLKSSCFNWGYDRKLEVRDV